MEDNDTAGLDLRKGQGMSLGKPDQGQKREIAWSESETEKGQVSTD